MTTGTMDCQMLNCPESATHTVTFDRTRTPPKQMQFCWNCMQAMHIESLMHGLNRITSRQLDPDAIFDGEGKRIE